jgi:hypothetical protein
VPTKGAVQWATDLAFDLWHISQTPTVTTQKIVDHRWERPTAGWLKCNVDVTFYAEQWQGATGGVLRDELGSFVRGSAKWYAHCLDALTMEALACRDGLLLAQQTNAQRVWMESDC